MKPACVAFDLDYTLSYFQGGYEGLFEIFRKRGVGDAAIAQAYGEAKTNGFTIEKLIDLAAQDGAPLDRGPIADEFRLWLKSALALYPDVLPFLERLRSERHLPVAIVTFGHPNHQEEKMRLLAFPYDRFVCVPETNAKHPALSELVDAYGSPILYVDDKASELDHIRERDSDNRILTARILRPDSPYRDQREQFPHIHIQSLDKLFGNVL